MIAYKVKFIKKKTDGRTKRKTFVRRSYVVFLGTEEWGHKTIEWNEWKWNIIATVNTLAHTRTHTIAQTAKGIKVSTSELNFKYALLACVCAFIHIYVCVCGCRCYS